jgi:hypothetical protein
MWTAYFMPLYMSIVLTEEYNVMVNSEELTGAEEYNAIDEVSHKPMSL